MVRPTEEYRIQKNGKSVQFFEKGEYCGSLPIKFLCALAKAEKAKDTILQSIQEKELPIYKEEDEEGG